MEKEIKLKGDKKLLASFRQWMKIDPDEAEALYFRFVHGIPLSEHKKNEKLADDIELEWALFNMTRGKNGIIKRSDFLSSEQNQDSV